MRFSASEAQVRAEIAAIETRTLRLEETPEPANPDTPGREAEEVSDIRSQEVSGIRSSPVLRLIEQTRVEREARNGRVAELFPRPETTEWNIREVAYDRRRRADIRSDPEAQHAS